MNPADVQLLLALIDIGTKAVTSIKAIKEDKPEVYAHIAKHHADALAALEAANSTSK
jgi:hypothetical protein